MSSESEVTVAVAGVEISGGGGGGGGGGGNGNGKREREEPGEAGARTNDDTSKENDNDDDDDDDDGPTTTGTNKLLKSSDESEKETTSDGRASSVEPTLDDFEGKELETTMTTTSMTTLDPGLSSGDEKAEIAAEVEVEEPTVQSDSATQPAPTSSSVGVVDATTTGTFAAASSAAAKSAAGKDANDPEVPLVTASDAPTTETSLPVVPPEPVPAPMPTDGTTDPTTTSTTSIPVATIATTTAAAGAAAAVAAVASDPRIMAAVVAVAASQPDTAALTSSPPPPLLPVAQPPSLTETAPASAAASLTMGLTSTVLEAQVEERGEVSAFYVGRVIGKGGEMIRDLQARSGARIDVDQNVPAGQPRVITYRGTRATVDFAKHLVQMLSTEGVHENDLPLGNASQEYLIIPAASVGKVIGRGGEMIRELQSRSQAKIQIDHTGVSGMPTDQKQVTLTGTHESVVKAKEMVLLLVANPLMDAQQALNMLIDDKIRNGTKWGIGPPYLNLPNQGINMQPSQIPGSLAYPGGGGSGGGGGGMHHQPHHHQPQQPPYGMYQQQPPPLQQHLPPGGSSYPPTQGGQAYSGSQWPGSGYPSAGAAYGDGRETDVFYAPKQLMGRIIGGKGVTVNDLQRRSGCDIQINQDVTPGQDCEITIKGQRAGIESAKAMIQEIIDVGPQHPYAGGMDNYGGGVGGAGMGGPPHGGGGGGYHGAYATPQYQAYPSQQQQHRAFEQPQMQPQGGYGGPGALYMAHGGGGGGEYNPPGAMGGGGYGAPYPGGGKGYVPPSQASSHIFQAPPQVSAWKAASAPDGQVYYYNDQTGATQWDKPLGMP